MKGISFVIRTLNEGLYLRTTLESIFSQNNKNFEVIIVDSGSSDNTKDIANEFNCNLIHINKEDWSWGRALNLGISHTIYENICIISGHCILTSHDFIDVAFNLLEEAQVIYGKQVPINGLDPFEEYELSLWYPSGKNISNTELIKNGKGVGVSNACCILDKNIWLEFKYDEKLQSMEDAEWAYRIAINEKEICYSPLLSVYHSHKFNPDYTYRKWYCRQYEGYTFLNENYGFYNTHIMGMFKFLMSDVFRIIRLPIEVVRMNRLLKNQYSIKVSSFLGYLLIRNIAIHNAFVDYSNNIGIDYWGVKSKSLKFISSLFKINFSSK